MEVIDNFTEGFQESNLPRGLLSEKLKSACQSSADPTVQLLGLTPGFIRQLPPIIVEFRYILELIMSFMYTIYHFYVIGQAIFKKSVDSSSYQYHTS